ncbi:MAG: VWA domain-containing protein [Bdellovibrionaceae bacterium]|nr:VWA domain-containing protein [Pseudobdellovibrionaceae bacterium]MDW8190331.1 VWA domain-containing protein [Pseudobdellovibrionaceae bacterium]
MKRFFYWFLLKFLTISHRKEIYFYPNSDSFSRFLVPFITLWLYWSCSPVQFNVGKDHHVTNHQPVNAPPSNSENHLLHPAPDFEAPTWYLLKEETYQKKRRIFQTEQESLEKNKTTLHFQVYDAQNRPVHRLQSTDFLIWESDVPINQFDFDSNLQIKTKVVDIVFAVDVTGSMKPTIDSAKQHLIRFIENTRNKGYHTRMCTLTFGDYTVKNCGRFYNNNIFDPTSDAEVKELMNEINSLKAITGPQNPGGQDFNENPMGALIDASKAPWGTQNLRYVILITDDGFLYSPDNQGSIGKKAPYMHQVQEAIQTSNMKIFAITPSLPGYNLPFTVREKGTKVTYPSIVDMSGGKHYDFNDFIAKKISLDQVLSEILVDATTSYQISFFADELRFAHIPLKQRKIRIEPHPKHTALKIVNLAISSNLPSGRAEYKKSWKISDYEVLPNSIKVTVNGIDVTAVTHWRENTIYFSQPPAPGSKIQVTFLYANSRLNFDLLPIFWNLEVTPSDLLLFVNGQTLSRSHYQIVHPEPGTTTLYFNDSLFTDEQYFINQLEKIELKVFLRK